MAASSLSVGPSPSPTQRLLRRVHSKPVLSRPVLESGTPRRAASPGMASMRDSDSASSRPDSALGGASSDRARGKQREHDPPLGVDEPSSEDTLFQADTIGGVDDDARSFVSSSGSAASGHARNTRNSFLDSQQEDGFDQIGPSDSRLDPRELLRRQLQRSLSRPGLPEPATRGIVTLDPTRTQAPHGGHAIAAYSRRRYFVLSTAGKLVYTTEEENEEEASGYAGVMQAIVSIFADEGDKIRYVDAFPTKIAFVLKPSLYLLCISDWDEPEFVLRNHLEYLYLHILSIVTLSQLTGIFSKRSNFDLRRLLEGTNPSFRYLIKTLQCSLPILGNSLEVLRLEGGTRAEMGKLLAPPKKVEDLLYVVLLHRSRPVTLLRPKSHSIHPSDLHLLLNTVLSNIAFRERGAESCLPICLPGFNSQGFLWAFVRFFGPAGAEGERDAGNDTGLVLVSADKDSYLALQALSKSIEQKLGSTGILARLYAKPESASVGKSRSILKSAVEEQFGQGGYSVEDLGQIGLRHFFYKNKPLGQVTAPDWDGDYTVDENRHRLMTLYQRVYESVHVKGGGAKTGSTKLAYVRSEHEAILGWATSSFELCITISPVLPKNIAVSIARAVSRWVKKEEGNLFLVGAPVF